MLFHNQLKNNLIKFNANDGRTTGERKTRLQLTQIKYELTLQLHYSTAHSHTYRSRPLHILQLTTIGRYRSYSPDIGNGFFHVPSSFFPCKTVVVVVWLSNAHYRFAKQHTNIYHTSAKQREENTLSKSNSAFVMHSHGQTEWNWEMLFCFSAFQHMYE